jgi:hypothetical protein
MAAASRRAARIAAMKSLWLLTPILPTGHAATHAATAAASSCTATVAGRVLRLRRQFPQPLLAAVEGLVRLSATRPWAFNADPLVLRVPVEVELALAVSALLQVSACAAAARRHLIVIAVAAKRRRPPAGATFPTASGGDGDRAVLEGT